MDMYATLSFTTVVAYAALVLTSLIFIVVIIDALTPKSDLEKAIDKLNVHVNGYTVRTDWRKVGVTFAVWFASGWYLFG